MFKELPGVLAFQRGMIVSDGVMYSIIPSGAGEKLEPIRVFRHGIRGINNSENATEVSNIQRTESAKTSHEAIGLQVNFAVRAIDAKRLLFACSKSEYRKAAEDFIEAKFLKGSDSAELQELCKRYARNILNGRWLWRNRVLGEITVEATHSDKTFSGKGSTTAHFDEFTADENGLAEVLMNQLCGNDMNAIEVSGRVMFGFAGEVEVFPSQNMVTGKPDGFARSLYKIDPISRQELLSIVNVRDKEGAGEFAGDMIDMGIAALRDQKIGNAIRTIDTWYPSFEQEKVIIPIEPNGASLAQNKFYREKPADAGTLLKKVDELSSNRPMSLLDDAAIGFSPDVAYLMAIMIRGGVFGEKSESKKA